MDRTIVRRAKYGDERGIHDAHMKSIRELCAKDYRPEQIDAWGGREFNYDSKKSLIDNHFVWVVERAGKIEGYGLLFISDEKKTAEIGALYFTPCVIGLGLGKAIVDEMKDVAKKKGLKAIFLDSTITSKSFYEKQGAIQYKEDDDSPIAGVPIESHPMRIDLD